MWIYTIVSIPVLFFNVRANAIGADGWELVSAWNAGSVVEEDKKTYVAIDCVFKKSVTPSGQSRKKR